MLYPSPLTLYIPSLEFILPWIPIIQFYTNNTSHNINNIKGSKVICIKRLPLRIYHLMKPLLNKVVMVLEHKVMCPMVRRFIFVKVVSFDRWCLDCTRFGYHKFINFFFFRNIFSKKLQLKYEIKKKCSWSVPKRERTNDVTCLGKFCSTIAFVGIDLVFWLGFPIVVLNRKWWLA